MKTMSKLLALGAFIFASLTSVAQYNNLTPRDLQQFRFPDQRGINQFEALDRNGVDFDGVKVRLGGAFAVQFQALEHSSGLGADTLAQIGNNFNLPTANLDVDVALADGLRMHMRTYLSSRPHPESWVKGGYIQVDKLDFIREGLLDNIMDITTIKVGLMEINYGDYHFRRSDNARAIYNPFVGNLILDAFNTEAGAEIYLTPGDFLFMAGVTNGKLNQGVATNGQNRAAFLGKVGWDKEINADLRTRITGSIYTIGDGNTNFLYFGDRGGSRYYMVMENNAANPTANFRSGRFSPSFVNEVTAIMINPFVKFKGFEFFGTYETSSGKLAFESETRTWTQLHGEALYRFGEREDVYVGAKYNVASGALVGGQEVSIDRLALAAGWFMTKNVMMKAEYVVQNYNDFAATDILNEGSFNGAVFEAVISF